MSLKRHFIAEFRAVTAVLCGVRLTSDSDTHLSFAAAAGEGDAIGSADWTAASHSTRCRHCW